MSATWQFYRQQQTDLIRNPISGEFFATEAVGETTESLVREAVQNSLDAREKNGASRTPAQIRIFLSEDSAALSPSAVKRWFGGLENHISAPRNGLRECPSLNDPCPYLVVEDFGTTGLEGDPEAYEVVDKVANHFLNFFRAEGHSDKGEHDRGSWGVGKTVFPRASRISSFFGLTVRANDKKRLLLGRSILKYHKVESQSYKSDGYFGIGREDNFVLPCDDPTLLDRFCEDFKVTRRAEPGLSIVVPWYDISGDDGISRDKIVAAVLKGFFYPIQMGHLSFVVATPAAQIALNAGTIIQTVQSLGEEFSADLLPMLQLAEWGQTLLPSEYKLLLAPAVEGKQKWSADLVPSSPWCNSSFRSGSVT